jgi:hypothetical protein
MVAMLHDMAPAGAIENEMKGLHDRVRDFSPDDAAWALSLAIS